MRSLAPICLLLAACGPVLLYGDKESDALPGESPPAHDAGAKDAGGGAAGAGGAPAPPDEPDRPRALLRVKSTDCGRCFELEASGADGQQPYSYQWSDGVQEARRQLCPDVPRTTLAVVVEDANAVRSVEASTQLEIDADAGCAEPPSTGRLCLTNPSFEGTPAPNVADNFDAPPWKACTNPAATNTPDVVNETLGAMTVPVPLPRDGVTYLALAENEQASEMLCESVPAGTQLFFEIDLSAFDVTNGVMPATTPTYLQIWGGLEADCSQRELLWASEALPLMWKRYCAKIKPGNFMDQITLRAVGDTTDVVLSYLLADNIVPVNDCP